MAEEEVTEEGGLRSQMYKHEGQVAFINEKYDINLDELSAAEIIAYAYATRVEWRKTDTYKELISSHAEEAEKEREAKALARAEAAAAKKAEKEAEAAAKAEKAAAAEKAPAATKAAKATKTPAKATKATKATKKASGGDSPFE